MRRSRRARSQGGLRPIDGAAAVTAPVGGRFVGRDDGLIGAEAIPSAAAPSTGGQAGQALRLPLPPQAGRQDRT